MSGVFTPQPWTVHAACRGLDTDLFFVEAGNNATQAKAVCKSCPVKVECVQYAVEHIEGGIWGGLTEKQRRRLSARPNPNGRGPAPLEHGTRRTMRTCTCPACVARLARERADIARRTANSKADRRLRAVAS